MTLNFVEPNRATQERMDELRNLLDKGTAWSVEKLADYFDTSERTVRALITALRRDGWVVCSHLDDVYGLVYVIPRYVVAY